MSTLNRLANCKNGYQGKAKRVLCVCSAGLLRSPTIAWVLSNDPWNYNTRAAGVSEEYALIPVDDVLIHWADLIVCANTDHSAALHSRFEISPEKIIVLGIPDKFSFRDGELVTLIKKGIDFHLKV